MPGIATLSRQDALLGWIPRHYGASTASQAATIARSSEVISVTLPGGIAFAHAALRPISRALRLMCAASSSRMPFGAVTIDAQTGSAAWHMLQRDRMISSTFAKGAGPPCALTLASRG